MSEQLEMDLGGPFSVRLSICDGLALFYDHYWSHRPKGKGTKKALSRLLKFFPSVKVSYVDEVSKGHIERLRTHLKSIGLKENTINTHHMIVTRFFNWLEECKEQGVVGGVDFRPIPIPRKNPGSQVPKVNEAQFQRKVAWSKYVVTKLIAACQRLNDSLMSDVIEALYLTRLRPGDLWRITSENVDFPHKILQGIQNKTITRGVPSGIPYVIPISEKLEKVLRRRMAENGPGSPLFVPIGMDLKNWRTSVLRRFKPIRVYANLVHVQLRDMRPSSATLLMDNGVDPMTVAESLGHTTLRMLPTYARRTLAHQRKAQRLVEDEETEIII